MRHLLATGVLAAVSGVLVLRDRAERQLGARRFQALITSFDTPDVYVANFFEVGQLESWFVDELRQSLEERAGNPVNVLSGRAWQVLRIHDAAPRCLPRRRSGSRRRLPSCPRSNRRPC